jgi:hypothetical protein
MPVLSFTEAVEKTEPETRHLLAGNGFSIAQGGARFDYLTLLDLGNYSTMRSLGLMEPSAPRG